MQLTLKDLNIVTSAAKGLKVNGVGNESLPICKGFYGFGAKPRESTDRTKKVG